MRGWVGSSLYYWEPRKSKINLHLFGVSTGLLFLILAAGVAKSNFASARRRVRVIKSKRKIDEMAGRAAFGMLGTGNLWRRWEWRLVFLLQMAFLMWSWKGKRDRHRWSEQFNQRPKAISEVRSIPVGHGQCLLTSLHPFLHSLQRLLYQTSRKGEKVVAAAVVWTPVPPVWVRGKRIRHAFGPLALGSISGTL